MFCKTYHATHPDMMEGVSNQDLRDRYLASGMFQAGQVVLNYSHNECFVIGGAVPAGQVLKLPDQTVPASAAAFSKKVRSGTTMTALSGQTYASSGLSTALLNSTLPGYADVVTNGDKGNWTITRITNSPTAAIIRGVEFAVQMPSQFLPGALKNFGGIFNMTLTDSNVDYANLQQAVAAIAPGTTTGLATAPLKAVTGPFVNASKTQYNIRLYYEDKKFGARVSYAYRSPYHDATSFSNGNVFDGFSAIKTVDASRRYTVFPNFDLTIDGNNLLDTYVAHFTDKDGPRNLKYYHTGRVIASGGRVKF